MPETVTGTSWRARGAVAELAVLVVSPALNRAAAQHRAGVVAAGGNSDRVGDARDRDGHRNCSSWSRCRAAVAALFPQH